MTAIPLLLTDEGSTGRLGFLPARGALYSSWKFRILEARSVSIETVLQRHEDALMALANVAAVGLGKKAERPVIMVHVTKKFPAAALSKDQIVPSELEGYEVVVAEIGTITAPEPPTDPH